MTDRETTATGTATGRSSNYKRSSTARKREVESSLSTVRSFFDTAKKEAWLWGSAVRHIWRTWEFIAEDLTNYTHAHMVDRGGVHVCLVPVCKWHHTGAH